jgi:peptidylprolyl isomerase
VPRRLIATASVAALVLLTAACGEDGESASGESESGGSDALAGVEVSGKVGESMDVTLDTPVESSEPQGEVLTAGEGAAVRANEPTLMHLYIGNATSGEQAVNTYENGAPVQVSLSEDQLFGVVLDEVVGENVGSRVAISAPASDVWGEQGAPQLQISGEDTVVFVADLVSGQPSEVVEGPEGEAVEPPADAPKVIEEDGAVTGFDWSDAPKQAPKKLTVIPLIKGDGPPARDDSMVTFDYFGAVWGADEPFDESYSREPVPFGVGIGQLIPAWDKVIPDLTRGSRVMIIAPPGEAYGDQGTQGIPADSTLVFVVDVLGVDES